MKKILGLLLLSAASQAFAGCQRVEICKSVLLCKDNAVINNMEGLDLPARD